MPIRAKNRARYPADWPQISRRILARAIIAANCGHLRVQGNDQMEVRNG